ncbi:MAG: flagellar protein FlgN [Planctomycetes bacterium]|nr:flagellar protein FlgN [Planctomycetota bacterium]
MTPQIQAQAQALVVQLRDHLEAELAIHRRLLASAEDKLQRLVAHDIPAFTAALAREQPLVAEMNRLRQVRDRLLRAIATVFSIRPDQFTLSAVIARLSEPLREALAVRQRELRSVLERLRNANDRNLLLVRSGLALVKDILQAVVGSDALPTADGYDRRGLHGAGNAPAGRLVNLAG